MTKKKQSGKHDQAERFVRIPHEWIESAAWRTLRPRAVRVLILLIYRWRPGGTYTLSARAPELGRTWGPLRRALDELATAGFITCVEHGGLYRKPDVYRLSENWRLRSKALIQDETQGRSQGKFGEWVPTRPKYKSAQAQLRNLKQNKGKRPRRKMMIGVPAKAQIEIS